MSAKEKDKASTVPAVTAISWIEQKNNSAVYLSYKKNSKAVGLFAEIELFKLTKTQIQNWKSLYINISMYHNLSSLRGNKTMLKRSE